MSQYLDKYISKAFVIQRLYPQTPPLLLSLDLQLPAMYYSYKFILSLMSI